MALFTLLQTGLESGKARGQDSDTVTVTVTFDFENFLT